MSSAAEPKDVEDELVDYEEEEAALATTGGDDEEQKEVKKGSYVGIHASGFRDFILKPELNRAVVDCGFEHPSEVQHECIPQAVLGMDVICQAKSGMGKTAVFVLTTLHQVEPEDDTVSVLVLCHARELAFQIAHEYERFSKYLPKVKTAVFFGGVPVSQNIKVLNDEKPNIVVGTPGRIMDLIKRGNLKVDKVKHFVVDECDKCLEKLDMRKVVQEIFIQTPHDKQVMMFSATMSKEIRPVCLKFCQDAMEVYVDNEAKLTLHGLQQYYIKLGESEKNRKLNDLLDALEFNQVVIFVSKVTRARTLDKLLNECNFPSICIHSRLKQKERLARYKAVKDFKKRILVSTDLAARGIDIERVNVVINYDFPDSSDTYLHRVNRAGRFGTKGLAISFVATDEDSKVLDEVQSRFQSKIGELPDEIDITSYMNV
eukprot:g3124.t1